MDRRKTFPINHFLVLALIIVLTIWLSPFILVLLVVLFIWRLRREKEKRDLIEEIKREWHPRGMFGVFLYSDSKIWKDYFEQELIPRIQEKILVWNWSTRQANGWNDQLLEARLLRLFKGSGHFYPSVFLVTPSGEVSMMKLHDAFIDFIKSGKPKYKELEKELLTRLNSLDETQ